ncbi:glycolate oxidase iron-sulfur subunit [Desulforamulus putei DSM 12395]|uniref:Glycolate oxidase iron-sulfur subunit n=1 Tax=Desulforamulus putei DSM 12395 TaxID=1121429 RepID=A0A1M4VTI9_9FIRM|nr:(Fe-S)-binding protein [Desulforamulus putei]SHE72132.1 glycolate oxidase iron-sulfur subunit [Desulforamulus putei DSM 12395]
MAVYDNIKGIEEEIIKCMKCGNCQAVCPVYKETLSESGVARGKIQLAAKILKGEAKYTPELYKKFDLCLQCQACSANCPCGVKAHKIIMAARAELARQNMLPFAKKAAFNILKKPGLFDFGLRLGSTFQGLAFRKNASGMSPRFPIGLEMRRVVPALADKPLRSELPEVNKAPNSRKKVAFFTGCVTNYIYTSVGKAVVDVLNHNGVDVIIPKEQHCCGAPAIINGDIETGKAMAKSHVDIFSKYDVDAIITVCGTCGGTFEQKYVELLADDPVYEAKARAVARKIRDISEYLVDDLKVNFAKLGSVPISFTYHEPCHIGRGMGLTRQPLEMLTKIPGITYKPMKQPNRCCGGAGSFSLTNYDVSYQILKKKMADIQGTNTNVVVTGCGSCRMQLEDGLAQEKMPHKVMHVIEVVQMAYQNAKEKPAATANKEQTKASQKSGKTKKAS